MADFERSRSKKRKVVSVHFIADIRSGRVVYSRSSFVHAQAEEAEFRAVSVQLVANSH